MSLSPESTEELFTAGNYLTAAWEGHPDRWQTYAALGLIGKTREAVEALDRFPERDARFYSAVARWIEGDESAAIDRLESIDTPHARRLLRLIRKPRIRVLAQLTWLRGTQHDLITGIARDEKFHVRNVSFHKEDVPNAPYADVHTLYDRAHPPDFYVTSMAEWHVKPPNLQTLPCPIFAQTSDFDVHIQALYPWLHLFDEIITPGMEWHDLRRIVRRPVCVCPRAFGLPGNLPPLPSGPREIDVFLSGTSLHAYHPDKARLYHQIMDMTDIKLQILNGFVDQATYFKMLGRAKVVFTYYRRDGGPLTRAIESLAMGCTVVMQRSNMLGVYVGRDQGLAAYDFDHGTLAPAIRRVLDEWPRMAPKARQGALAVRREFALAHVAAQYFRFLTFLAAKPRGPRRLQPMEPLDQRRLILWKGLLPAPAPMLQKLREQSIARWQSRPEMNTDPRCINNIGRELILEYAAVDTGFHRMQGSLACEQLLSKILEIYRAGIARFPRSLVLRFNLVRVALLFGQPHEVSKALALGEETLAQPESSWNIDVMEDVLPWDFCETYFNYRAYFDTIVRHLSSKKPVRRVLIRLILASLSYYLGHYAPHPELHRRACALDPDFPFYRFGYARRLIQRGEEGDYAAAGALLTTLATESILLCEAFTLLEHLKNQGRYLSPRYAQIEGRVTQARQSSSLLETQPYVLPLKPAYMLSANGRPARAAAAQPPVPFTEEMNTIHTSDRMQSRAVTPAVSAPSAT